MNGIESWKGRSIREDWRNKPLPSPLAIESAIRREQVALLQLADGAKQIEAEQTKRFRLQLAEHVKWLGKIAEEVARRERDEELPFGRYATDDDKPVFVKRREIEEAGLSGRFNEIGNSD